MTSSVQVGAERDGTRLLEALGADYRGRGFTFVVEPTPDALPAFMEGYRPDAVAMAPGRNVAFEIKGGRGGPPRRPLAELRRRFAGHPDWQFQVIMLGTDPLDALAIGHPGRDEVRARRKEVGDLSITGHRAAAFAMSWALLEATYRSLRPGKEGRALPSGSVVQELAMDGRIEPDTERRLRGLIDLRNRVVHGDLGADPAPEDVEAVLSAVDEALDAADA